MLQYSGTKRLRNAIPPTDEREMLAEYPTSFTVEVPNQAIIEVAASPSFESETRYVDQRMEEVIKRKLVCAIEALIATFDDIRLRQMAFVEFKRAIAELWSLVKHNEKDAEKNLLVILHQAVGSLRSEALDEEKALALRRAIDVLEEKTISDNALEKLVDTLLESGIRLLPKSPGLWKLYQK